MSLLRSEKSKSKQFDKSDTLLDDRKIFNRSGGLSNNFKLADVEEKVRLFGGL